MPERSDQTEWEPSASLLARACAGEREAVRELMQQSWPRLLRWARIRTPDQDEAEDVAQEAAIRVLRGLPSFRQASSFSTWSYTIVRNVNLDRARARTRRVGRESRREEVSELTGDLSEGLRGADSLQAKPDSIDRSRLLTKVRDEFYQMTERQRTIFAMVDVEGLSCADVAARLDLAPSTVRVTLMKARKRIRERLLESHPSLVEASLE